MRTGRSSEWWRIHRLSVLVLLLVGSLTVAGFLTARHLVSQHERDLLIQEAGEITLLFDQLGTSFQSGIVGVAAIADATGANPERFVEDVAQADQGGGWALALSMPTGLVTATTVGDVTVDLAAPPAGWAVTLDALEPGDFSVLGLVGDGDQRRLGLAARAGDVVVYNELPLFAAAAASAADSASGDTAYDAFDIALYVGAEPSDEGLVFQTADPGPDAIRQVVDIGGTKVTLVIGSHEALGGSLISRWPLMVVALGLVGAVGLAAITELSLRRRDDALGRVAELAAQNAILDTALEELRAAEAMTATVEAELRQMQRLESVGQLAGGVAHDFNNLLAVILSYADLLESQLDRDDETDSRGDLEEIRLAARRGADLTRRLLQFSRQHVDDASVVDVGAVVTDLSRLLERTIGEDITLRTVHTEDACTALLDAQSLEQAVLNLVINARDAVGSGGTITITTGCVDIDPAHSVQLGGLAPGRYVRLTVTDDGAGMPPEVARRSFDPFFTTKGRGEGTGLGLATVYGMVKSNGGHVSIESEEGVGTSVTLLFPEVDEHPRATPVHAPPTPAPPSTARILLVEDEPAVRAAVRRMLGAAGYAVLEAADGQQAIRSFSGADIDLVITDVVMPGGVTGAEVAQHLRRQRPDLPALFVTGYGLDVLEQRGIVIDGSTTAVLEKPFREAELLAAVRRALTGPER